MIAKPSLRPVHGTGRKGSRQRYAGQPPPVVAPIGVDIGLFLALVGTTRGWLPPARPPGR